MTKGYKNNYDPIIHDPKERFKILIMALVHARYL